MNIKIREKNDISDYDIIIEKIPNVDRDIVIRLYIINNEYTIITEYIGGGLFSEYIERDLPYILEKYGEDILKLIDNFNSNVADVTLAKKLFKKYIECFINNKDSIYFKTIITFNRNFEIIEEYLEKIPIIKKYDVVFDGWFVRIENEKISSELDITSKDTKIICKYTLQNNTNLITKVYVFTKIICHPSNYDVYIDELIESDALYTLQKKKAIDIIEENKNKYI